MIIELTFPTGRFHATAWGRHVNEAVPEWPPAPFRLLRALLDAWYRKHSDIQVEVVEQLMAALSRPPLYSLPPARAGHTRSYLSQNKEDTNDKKLVFDGFAVVDRQSKVLLGWPALALDSKVVHTARTLLGSLNYLGRSESWVEASLLDDDRCIDWNCVPLSQGAVPTGKEVVSVACVVTPEAFAARRFELPAKRKIKARQLAWLEALTWGSQETIEHTMNLPPALEPLFYLRDSDALNARPKPVHRSSNRIVEAVLFSVDGRVKAPITDALRVSDQVRRNLMGSLRKVLGNEEQSPTFSGKDMNGRPVSDHSHVSILPLDEDGDGYIDALLLTSPKPFSLDEQRAIDRLHPVRRANGHPLILTPLRYGTCGQLMTRTTMVVSHTPFAPTRHWRSKRDGDFDAWLMEQLSLECRRRGLPRPLEARRVESPICTRRRARWLDFRRARKDDAPQPAYGLRATFAEDVWAPFSLGYASHFGLGCFVALRSSSP